MRTLGFGAAWRAGKASASDGFGRVDEDDAEADEAAVGRVVVDGEGREVAEVDGPAVPQTVVVVGPEVRGAEVEAESGGKGFPPTAERDDCAVDDFSRSTRFPPAPAPLTVPGDSPGRTPLGPGSAG